MTPYPDYVAAVRTWGWEARFLYDRPSYMRSSDYGRTTRGWGRVSGEAGYDAEDGGGGSLGFVAEPLLSRDGLFPIGAWHGLDVHARRLAAAGGGYEMPEALDHVQPDAVGFARVLPDGDHDLGVGDDGLDVAERRALAHSAHGELALIGERDHHAGEVGLVAPGEGDRGFVHAAGLRQPVLPAFVRRVKFWSRGAWGRPAGIGRGRAIAWR